MRLKICQAPCDLLQGDEGGQRLSFVDFTGRLITLNPIFGCNQFDSSPGLWAATAAIATAQASRPGVLPKLIVTKYRTEGA